MAVTKNFKKNKLKQIIGKISLMTWIVVSPTMFGYGVGVSDTRITFADGATKDCLQKIYKVGDDVVVGFAGSVYIGFKVLDGVIKMLPSTPDGYALEPKWVSENLPKLAKNIFSEAPKEAQTAGCALILIGCSPNEHLGDAPFAKTIAAILKAPDFVPKYIKIGKWDGIGSGMGVNQYSNIISQLNDDSYHPLMQMEVGSPGGWGFAIQTLLNRLIKENPTASVSPYIHMCTVSPNKITITGTNFTEYGPDGKKEYVMPKIARSWNELINITGLTEGQLMASSCSLSVLKQD
jgi:hypothetical protein